MASTLAERRPADEPERLEFMLRRADLIVTARDGSRLWRSMWHTRTAGRQLIMETRAAAGEAATLFLVAAPAAEGYYPHIGMEPVSSCWKLSRSR